MIINTSLIKLVNLQSHQPFFVHMIKCSLCLVLLQSTPLNVFKSDLTTFMKYIQRITKKLKYLRSLVKSIREQKYVVNFKLGHWTWVWTAKTRTISQFKLLQNKLFLSQRKWSKQENYQLLNVRSLQVWCKAGDY